MKKRLHGVITFFLVVFVTNIGFGQINQYFDASATNAFTASKWSSSCGGGSSAFVAGNIANFCTVNGTGNGSVGISVGGIIATENYTHSSPSGTLTTGGTVITIDVASGKIFNLAGGGISTAAGTGLIKSGNGTYQSSNGNAFTGGFTLNAGTMLIGGVNAMGAGGSLTINGGTLAGTATRDLSSKYAGGISVNGNIQFGEVSTVVTGASNTANLTFTNNMVLGSVSRILTLGNSGITTFGGVISGTGANITFTANSNGSLGIFNLTGANTYTGTTTVSGGTLRLNKTGGATLPSANSIIVQTGGILKVSVNQTLVSLIIDNGGRLLVDPGVTLTITGFLKNSGIITNNGTITAPSGAFTITSDATGTGSLGGGPGSATITNNVTVERYIPSNNRKSYTMVSSPVSGPTIKAAWQEDGTTVTGYGTQITGGTAGTAATNGFDTTSVSGFASIFTYDDTKSPGSKWVGLTNTNVNILTPGKGYLLYVRGDRTIAPGSASVSNTTLRATGTVAIGDVFVTPALTTTAANKFNLIANPYACAVKWSALTTAFLTTTFYTYDPNKGVFVSYNSVGDVLSPSDSKQQKDTIQSGQAFFVQNAASGTPSIIFTEASKVATASTASDYTVFGNDAPSSQLNINIYNKSNELADGVVAIFGNNYKAGIAKEDAGKMDNFNENFSLTRNNNRLSIEGRPTIKGNDTLFFAMNNFSKKEYVLKIDGSNFSEANATLIDNYTGTKTAIDLAGINTYNFTVNGDAASAGNDRFMITFGSTTNIAAGETTETNNLFVKLSPNPVSNQLQVNFKTATTANTVIKVINSLGQTVKTVNAGKVNAGNISIPTGSLADGLYTVQLISGDKKIASQKIVKN